MEIPMADQKCVALKCEVKEIFDKDLKPAVLQQIKKTVQTLVDKTNGLAFEEKCKDGCMLTATVVSLKVDNADTPKAMEAKVLIEGVPLFGTAKGFKANGNSKASGINAKRIEDEAKSFVEDVLKDVMTKQAIPQMLKT
jgi:hypothetical protein